MSTPLRAVAVAAAGVVLVLSSGAAVAAAAPAHTDTSAASCCQAKPGNPGWPVGPGLGSGIKPRP